MQRVNVAGIRLRQRDVEVTPPVARRPLHDSQVLRLEHDYVHFAEQVHRAPLHAVHANLFAKARIIRRVFIQRNVDARQWAALIAHFGADPHVR